MIEYPEIRAEMEEKGYVIEDAQYEKVVAYAQRKAKCSGKDESYMPYLLPDVIKEWVIRAAINTVTIAAMTAEKILKQGGTENGSINNERVACQYPERIGVTAQ